MNSTAFHSRRLSKFTAAACALLTFFGTSCTTTPTSTVPTAPATAAPAAQVLQAGDVVKIAFPGAASMDATQQIRRDGKLNLVSIGEVTAAGKTPAEFEKELLDLYSNQLVSKEVKVMVVTSSYSVYVTGSVTKPGKIQPDHALTAFDAIMEAGGFDYAKANTREVRVIRTQGSETKTFVLDMKAVLEGRSTTPFYLQSGDTVYVPEKVQLW